MISKMHILLFENVCVFRRQELRELRLLQKEEQRALAVLQSKLESQREQIQKRFEQELNVSLHLN